MRPSRIRRKLIHGHPALITTLNLADFGLFEFVSLMGFDGIWLDLEHHALSVETAQNLMRAARVGASDIVARPAKGEFMRLGRLLEAGAQGIMYPRCESAAEAAEVVKWAKFPPLGRRGIDGGNPDVPYCSIPPQQYVKAANEQTFLILQLEDPLAISMSDEIAAVDGVDVLFLGPGDYSSLGGFAGQMDHPELAKATEKIARAAQRAGKYWGRPAATLDEAREFLSMGASLISHTSDIRLLKANYERIQREFGELGFEFENQLNGNAPANHFIASPHFRAPCGSPESASIRVKSPIRERAVE
jgi:4-hydroxy-2-oxoheptanedioate aldolase